MKFRVGLFSLLSFLLLLHGSAAFDMSEYIKCTLCDAQKLSGLVEDCCCDIDTLRTSNSKHFLPTLNRLSNMTFFRLFKVDLWRECPFWPDDGTCSRRDCGVEECTEEEVPQSIRQCDEAEISLVVGGGKAEESNFEPWSLPEGKEEKEIWGVQSEGSAELTYIDLLRNPEGYTGYAGEDAHRIWSSIYNENCFQGPFEGLCLEERVFFRLLSGIHASISTHLSARYQFSDGTWGHNVPEFVRRVGRHPQRIQNIYFAYLFVLRAVAKAEKALAAYEYRTGDPAENTETLELIKSLTAKAAPQVLQGFDESALFKVRSEELWASCPEVLHGLKDVHDLQHRYIEAAEQKAQLKNEFQHKFRNISMIMDCVGCEKCRLWGKVQFLGLGTAIKILFADTADMETASDVVLTRNEIVALINTMHRLSISVDMIDKLRDEEATQAMQKILLNATIGVFALVGLGMLALRMKRGRKKGESVEAGGAKKNA